MTGFRKIIMTPAWVRTAMSYGIEYDKLMAAYAIDSDIEKSFTHGMSRTIEATGTQYILTDTNIVDTDEFSIHIDYTPTRLYDYNAIWGTTYDQDAYECWVCGSGVVASRYNMNKASGPTIEADESLVIKNVLRDGEWSLEVNGEKTSVETNAVRKSAPMTIFKSFSEMGEGKLKYLYSRKGIKLENFFIPFIDSDGTRGMYDLVRGKFYGNAGTGVFAIDEKREWIDTALAYGLSYDKIMEAHSIDPDIEYSFTSGKARWLVSDGKSYVNTNTIPTDNSYVQTTFRATAYKDRDWYFGCEVWNTATTTTERKRFGVFIRESSICPRLGNTGGGDDYPANPLTTDAVVALGHKLLVINEQIVESQATDISIEGMLYPLYIFASCSDGSPTGNGNISTAKMKNYFIWYEGTELIHFFVPFKNEDGEYGLYDLVEGAFYPSEGSGTLSVVVEDD